MKEVEFPRHLRLGFEVTKWIFGDCDLLRSEMIGGLMQPFNQLWNELESIHERTHPTQNT